MERKNKPKDEPPIDEKAPAAAEITPKPKPVTEAANGKSTKSSSPPSKLFGAAEPEQTTEQFLDASTLTLDDD